MPGVTDPLTLAIIPFCHIFNSRSVGSARAEAHSYFCLTIALEAKMKKETKIRELSAEELKQVAGGTINLGLGYSSSGLGVGVSGSPGLGLNVYGVGPAVLGVLGGLKSLL